MIKKIAIVVLIVALVLGLGYFYPKVVGNFSMAARTFVAVNEQKGPEDKNAQKTMEIGEGPYFCPEDACADKLGTLIDAAQSKVYVAVYSFTLDELGDALVRAKNRGVDVRAVLEKDQVSQYSEYEKLVNAGIDARLDSNPDSMHDKFVVVDSWYVATGSFNWSANADERNDENLIIIKNRDWAAKYEAEFNEIFDKSA